jgi:hypothetical protein
MNITPSRKKYLLVAIIAVVCVIGLIVFANQDWAQEREIAHLLTKLSEADRQRMQGLSQKGQLLFAVGRPEIGDQARQILVRLDEALVRDDAWRQLPEAAEVAERLIVGFDKAAVAEKLAVLKLLRKLGPTAAIAAPDILLALSDPDQDVCAAAESAATAVGGGKVPDARSYPALLPRLQQRLESQVENREPWWRKDGQLLTVLSQLAQFDAQAKSAVPLLMRILERARYCRGVPAHLPVGGGKVGSYTDYSEQEARRQIFLAALKALDALDDSWIDRADQPELVRLLTEWISRDDQQMIDLVARVLPRLSRKAASALPELIPLTCHPSPTLRAAIWKTLVVINPTKTGEAAAVKAKTASLISWAATAKSPEEGGALLADSLIRTKISEVSIVEELVVEMAQGTDHQQRVIATALDKWLPKWRKTSAIRSIVDSRPSPVVTLGGKVLPSLPHSLSERVWDAWERKAYWAASSVEWKDLSELEKVQRAWKESSPLDSVYSKVAKMSKPAQQAYRDSLDQSIATFRALIAADQSSGKGQLPSD